MGSLTIGQLADLKIHGYPKNKRWLPEREFPERPIDEQHSGKPQDAAGYYLRQDPEHRMADQAMTGRTQQEIITPSPNVARPEQGFSVKRAPHPGSTRTQGSTCENKDGWECLQLLQL
ncbi:unnamed protein product [Cuscuta epithymum]|uniref:Uncharacterized protein n=1 Tax=Cuscuta epithymum TaxID=186058 RepID=A0AAV0EPX9_9ASTE|nr:unnamed protein product [Cuscuta epithymum]